MAGQTKTLVGRDVARMPRTPRPRGKRRLAGGIIGCLLAALALAALRVDLIRAQYGLASLVNEEKLLLERHRGLTAEVRRLRDPARLARLGREWGFALPERVIELAGPAWSHEGVEEP